MCSRVIAEWSSNETTNHETRVRIPANPDFSIFFSEHFLSLNLLLTFILLPFLKPEYLFINCDDIISGFRKHSKESKNHSLTSESYTLYLGVSTSCPYLVWATRFGTSPNRLRNSRAFERVQEWRSNLRGSGDSHTPYFEVFASYPLWALGTGSATLTNCLRTLRAFQRAQEHLSSSSGSWDSHTEIWRKRWYSKSVPVLLNCFHLDPGPLGGAHRRYERAQAATERAAGEYSIVIGVKTQQNDEKHLVACFLL